MKQLGMRIKIIALVFIGLAITANSFGQTTADEWYKKATEYHNSGDYTNAVIAYSETIKRDNSNLNAYWNRGVAYFQIKNYDAAIADCNTVINGAPDFSDAYVFLGDAYGAKGIYHKAVADYRTGLKKGYDPSKFIVDKSSKADMWFCSAMYMEIVINRSLNKFNVVEKYEKYLKTVCDKNGVTSAEVEAYYRNNIRGLVSDNVDEQVRRSNARISNEILSAIKNTITDFMLAPSRAAYNSLLQVYRRYAGDGAIVLAHIIEEINPDIRAALNDNAASRNAVTFNSIEELKKWLTAQPDNITLDPYAITLNVRDLTGIKDVLQANEKKYVILDLSGGTFTRIGDEAFSECTSLTGVTIGSRVTSIGNSAFSYCTSLASVTIPNSVTSIGTSAFFSCRSLKSVTIPDSVIGIGDTAFSDCYSLNTINIAVVNTAYTTQDGVLYNKNKTVLITYPAGKKDISFIIPNSVTSIGNYAFSFCSNLTSITIPNSVTSIGNYAFRYCTNLTSVTIPNSVTSFLEGSFYCCTNLTSVTFIGIIYSDSFISGNNWHNSPFPGDLRDKFYAKNKTYGTTGTYTRASNESTWTKVLPDLKDKEQIYIIGNDGNDAVYWLNGQRQVLPKTSGKAYVTAIAFSDTDVYIVGKDGNNAVYWLNGLRNVISTDSSVYANAIAFSDLGDIYYVGGYGSDAFYSLNGQVTILPRGNFIDSTSAEAIILSGSNIYIIGNENYLALHGKTEPILWLNAESHRISTLEPQNIVDITAKAIAVSGSNVYIVGREQLSSRYSENFEIMIRDRPINAVYWLNGQIHYLPTTGNDTSANAIAISGSNVYIAGSDGNNAVYWLNGQKHILPSTGKDASANAIAVSGSNVYIVGKDGNNAVYWLNGQRHVLPSTGNNASALRIAIMR